MVIQRFIVVNK